MNHAFRVTELEEESFLRMVQQVRPEFLKEFKKQSGRSELVGVFAHFLHGLAIPIRQEANQAL